MLRLLFVLVLLFSQTARAGDIQHLEVKYKEGVYRLNFDVTINADLNTVHAIVTDYERLDRLSDILIESVVIPGTATDPIRRRLITEACMVLFCMKVVTVEEVEEIGKASIFTKTISEESDFKSGKTEWRLSEGDNGGTRIRFYAEEEPGFWVPPFVGPLWLKGKLSEEAKKTIERIEALAANDA